MAREGGRVAELRLSTLADSIAVRLLLAVMDPSVDVSTRLDDTVLPGLALLRLSSADGDVHGGDAAPVVAVVGDDETAFERSTWAFADAVGADVVYFLPRHSAELTEMFGPPVPTEPLAPVPSGGSGEPHVCRCGNLSSSTAQSGQVAPR